MECNISGCLSKESLEVLSCGQELRKGKKKGDLQRGGEKKRR